MDVAEILEDLTPEKAAAIGSAAQAKVLASNCYSSRAREADGLLRGVHAEKQAGGGKGAACGSGSLASASPLPGVMGIARPGAPGPADRTETRRGGEERVRRGES